MTVDDATWHTFACGQGAFLLLHGAFRKADMGFNQVVPLEQDGRIIANDPTKGALHVNRALHLHSTPSQSRRHPA